MKNNDHTEASYTEKDSEELKRFGYSQQLNRMMGGFSSFAISFSLISVLTGIFANFNFGFRQVGGAIVWSWLLVGGGQFLVALVMADLSNRFPISGYGYQWSARMMNPHFGFFVGWLLLIQFITGFPGTSEAMAVTISSMMGGASDGWGVVFITLAVMTVVAIIHLSGIRLVSIINNLGVYAELAGVVLLIGALAVIWFISGAINAENLFKAVNVLKAESAGLSSFALSLLLGAWCLTGFEAAADMAEETKSPHKNVPRAVILSQVSASIAGFLMIGLLVVSAGDIHEAQKSSNPLIFILKNAIGERGTAIATIIIVLSIFACAVASMATATRLLFSLSRDNILPFSSILSRINEKRQTPQYAIIAIWAFSCLAVLLFKQIEVITSVSAAASYLGYAGIMLAAILSKKSCNAEEGFSLGALRKPVQLASLCWTLIVAASIMIPETEIDGLQIRHLPAVSALIVVIAGIVLYFLSVRGKINKRIAGPPDETPNLSGV